MVAQARVHSLTHSLFNKTKAPEGSVWSWFQAHVYLGYLSLGAPTLPISQISTFTMWPLLFFVVRRWLERPCAHLLTDTPGTTGGAYILIFFLSF